MASDIESMMNEVRSFAPSAEFSQRARVKSLAEYERLYRESVEQPDAFWGRMANEELHWFRPWTQVHEQRFEHIGEQEGPYTRWFSGGQLNVSYNCLDRHLNGPRRNKAAFIWQGEKEGEKRTLTYLQLHREVCRLANVLTQFQTHLRDGIRRFIQRRFDVVFLNVQSLNQTRNRYEAVLSHRVGIAQLTDVFRPALFAELFFQHLVQLHG